MQVGKSKKDRIPIDIGIRSFFISVIHLFLSFFSVWDRKVARCPAFFGSLTNPVIALLAHIRMDWTVAQLLGSRAPVIQLIYFIA